VTDLTSELLIQQDALQAEARAVEADLHIEELFSPVGEVHRVGSAALGLMVWRDLDLTIVCPKLAVDSVAAISARLARHPRVRRVEFRNDTGHWNTDPQYPDGLYLGVGYRSLSDMEWKLDIWFVDEPERQPDLAHLRWMPRLLTSEKREAILRIKSAWVSEPEYGKAVKSFDIYLAVLTDDVRTRDQFQAWIASRPPTE
jgi:hypothetical protein